MLMTPITTIGINLRIAILTGMVKDTEALITGVRAQVLVQVAMSVPHLLCAQSTSGKVSQLSETGLALAHLWTEHIIIHLEDPLLIQFQ